MKHLIVIPVWLVEESFYNSTGLEPYGGSIQIVESEEELFQIVQEAYGLTKDFGDCTVSTTYQEADEHDPESKSWVVYTFNYSDFDGDQIYRLKITNDYAFREEN